MTTSSTTILNGHARVHANSFRDVSKERRRVHHEADAIIVGAGIVGSALAVALGNQGRSVLLLERSLKEPDRIVGEYLQPGGVRALEKLGLRHCLEEIDAIRSYGFDVIYYGTDVILRYPRDQKTSSPVEGRSFHHGRFIMRLREAAAANSNVTVVETTAVAVIRSTHGNEILGVQCLTNGEQKDYYFAPLTFIADGYNSPFRKQFLPHKPVVKSKFWGLELIDVQLPFQNFGHIVLGDGPPVLMYQIGTRETRALVDIPNNLPSASVANGGVKGHLLNTVLPSLPKSVQSGFKAAVEKGPLRSMPNSFLPPTTNRTPGLIFLGDSLNMRHPLTGGGMTVGFNDVITASELLSPANVPSFTDSKLVMKQMARFHWRRKNSTTAINILAQALYSLFAANDAQLKVLQRGCIRYFQLGMVKGPMGLIGGIIHAPFVLVRHFYAVALLSIWEHLRSSPAYLLPLTLLQCVAVFITASRVILPFILAELRS